MVHTTCAALHCLSSSHTDKDLKFHQFPHNAERRKMWITACKRSDVIDKDWDFFKHQYVCSLHFQKSMYSKNDCLKKSAIPSLHLSEKPLQHDSSKQTVESIQYVNQRSENYVSISYVIPNVEKNSTTIYTETEDSLPYDVNNVNIIEEIITHTNLEQSESVEQKVEIKTEDDDGDENSDSGAFEADVDIKIEIVENEILPLVQPTQSAQSLDLKLIKDGGTTSTQARNLLQEIDQGLTTTIVNRSTTYPINTNKMPMLKRKMDGSIKTDGEIVLRSSVKAGELNAADVFIAGTETANSTEADLYSVDRVEASAADCARSRKRRVSFNQLETLWEILNENINLATGYNKTAQAREYSKRMWQVAADTLNSQSDGAEKDWKSWCKYWNDYKSKLKTKVASARASLQRTGGGPSIEGRLSDLDLKFLQILGVDFGAGLPGVRVEPSFNIPTEDRTEAGSAPLLSANSEQSENILAHHLNMDSVLDILGIPPEPTAAASTPPAPALRTTPPPPPAQTPPPRAPSGPRRTLRRRLRQRRAVPMSAATARHALVNMSEARVRLEERRNQILENIALELRDIKGILNTRLVICDNMEMDGLRWGLETPLNPKRMRMWQQFMECKGWESASSMPAASPAPPRHCQHMRDENTADIINYGSDAGSDESDDEETIVRPTIPRVLQSVMETPLDQEEDAPGEDAAPAADPAPASVPPMATDQPWSWYDFEWRAFPDSPIPPESRRETFSESNVGPTTPRDDPYDIFVDIWDRQIMEYIASETNRYAQQVATQMLDNHSLPPNSRIGQWCNTTADELYVYFGLILSMGIVVKSRLEEYWTATSDIFYTPGFSVHMSLNRFLVLSKCLHFNNNEDMCALKLDGSEARIFKIQPILSHLNMKFQSMYTPAQNIALDESLLTWKGWLETRQLIPNEAANRGIKTYEICESQTGYLWRFEVHAHTNKSPPQQFEDPLEASTPSTVLRLTQGLEHKGYTLWMDNFYNSPCLARQLKSLGFDCVGTLRTDRKFVPRALHSLTKRNMTIGQVSGLTSGDVDVMIWRDNNRVAAISTYHGIGQSTYRGSTKPILISDYHIMMGGVDRKDRLLAMYPVERKQTRVWYKKLFRRLLNVSVLNSYIIHHHSSSLSHRNFRISLVKSLLSKHCGPPLPPVTTQNQNQPVFNPDQPVDVTHRLDELPMGKSQRKRRVCTVCKKQVKTFCVGCGKTVCMKPCFLTIHS